MKKWIYLLYYNNTVGQGEDRRCDWHEAGGWGKRVVQQVVFTPSLQSGSFLTSYNAISQYNQTISLQNTTIIFFESLSTCPHGVWEKHGRQEKKKCRNIRRATHRSWRRSNRSKKFRGASWVHLYHSPLPRYLSTHLATAPFPLFHVAKSNGSPTMQVRRPCP